MKIVIVCPDDLSTEIFGLSFSEFLCKFPEYSLDTVSPVYYGDIYLKNIYSNHINIRMDRYFNPFYDLLYFFTLYKIFKVNKYDCILTFTTKPNLYGILAAFFANIPIRIMAVRGLGRTFSKSDNFFENLIYFFVRRLYKFSALCCSYIWFTNPHDYDRFKLMGVDCEHKKIITTNAINLNKYSKKNISEVDVAKLRLELDIVDGDFVVLMVARLIQSKGVVEFIEMAKSCHKIDRTIKFLLVAPKESDSFDSVPVDYVKAAESCSNFKWLGFRSDTMNLYFISNISVLPSYYNEGGYPRALLEAMAFGKPVIAADTISCRGPVENGINGFLVEPRNHEDLLNKIMTIRNNKNLELRFGISSKEIVSKKFSDESIVKKIVRYMGVNGVEGDIGG